MSVGPGEFLAKHDKEFQDPLKIGSRSAPFGPGTTLDTGICYNFELRVGIGAGLNDHTFWETGTYAS